MSFASIAILVLAAGVVRPAAHTSHADPLAEGRSVVESMLFAVEQQDNAAFGRVVDKAALMSIGSTTAPVEMEMIPAEFGCTNPKVTKVEPSENVVGDSKVTVAWACKQRRPNSGGKMVIRFWVHGGKVIFGERI